MPLFLLALGVVLGSSLPHPPPATPTVRPVLSLIAGRYHDLLTGFHTSVSALDASFTEQPQCKCHHAVHQFKHLWRLLNNYKVQTGQ